MWQVSVAQQLRLFAYSALVGAALGAVYDLFRLLRSLFPKTKGFVIFVEDMTFCAVCTGVYIVFIYAANLGVPRLYSAASAACGFALWYFTLGRITVPVFTKLLRFISAPLKALLDIINKILSGILCKVTIFVKTAKKRFTLHKKRYKIYDVKKSGK